MNPEFRLRSEDMTQVFDKTQGAYFDSRLSPDKYFEIFIGRTRAHLSEAGIYSGKVDFLRDAQNTIMHGSSRIPLLLTLSDGIFILKDYDSYDKSTEQKILKMVAGTLAPQVRFFGKEFYIEQFLSPSMYRSLEIVADTGHLNKAVNYSAYGFARLAKMRIRYCHNHFLDEFHVDQTEDLKITDFGVSGLFYHQGQQLSFDDYLKVLSEYGLRDMLLSKISPLANNQNALSVVVKTIYEISQNQVEQTNHAFVFFYAARGLKEYLERRGFRDPWAKAVSKMPEFAKAYRNYLR